MKEQGNTSSKLITATTYRALHILQEYKPTSDSGFAELMWPDSLMHVSSSRAGTHGSRRGAGAWLCSGSYLGKLQKRGLVYKRHVTDNPWENPIATVTALGLEACRNYDASQIRESE